MDDQETVKNAQQSLGYFIAYKDLFSTWIHMGSDFSIDNVRTALSSFERLISPTHKKVFDKIFNTLETGLSKLGENTKSQTKAASDLIQLIDEIPMDDQQDYDVLGFIYEYLIGQFASNAGKKAGEFYTPHEVSLLMAEIIANYLKDRNEISIYDPCSGSGSLLLNIGRACSRYLPDSNHIKYYAQELKANTYNLTRMNLVMRGILPDNIFTRNGDTLEEDWPYFDESDPASTYEPLYVDAVVTNPPYSQRWSPKDKENDPRFSRYGLAPQGKADYAFLLHDLYHVKPDGIMTIVLPHGVLFRGNEEGNIRKNLIEFNNIDAIIGLPANIFYGTGIPTIVMVLRQKRENTDVLFIDASKGFAKEGKNNKLRACDIQKIVDTVKGRLDIPKYSRNVSREEIRANDYNLNIPRYVDSSEDAENWDIYSLMYGGIPETELNQLDKYWKTFPTLKQELFTSDGKHAHIKADDVKKVITENKDVRAYLEEYKNTFADFGDKLSNLLINHATDVSPIKAEDTIIADLRKRFENVKLIDFYSAFEEFSNAYTSISGDLELIQEEGMDCVKQIDPHMVMKKKDNKEIEVQDGWQGHILPFDVVQNLMLKDKVLSLRAKNDRIQEIEGSIDSILEELSDDEKQTMGDALDEDGTKFVYAKIPSVIKTLTAENDEENQAALNQLKQVNELNGEEKKLKSQVKEDSIDLEKSTRTCIENLTDEDVHMLLRAKWIDPLCEKINALPNEVINSLEKTVSELCSKYADTSEDIENQISETEASLSKMLSQLTGSEEDMAGIRELQKLLGGNQ